MSKDRITQALLKLFERHRIVFWYDAKSELRSDFEALEIPEVAKLEINNNEFAIKYHILRENCDQKFLLYRDGPQPAEVDNWLLDVQLANAEFRTDQIAMWLAELELGIEFAKLLEQHEDFFRSTKRLQSLKSILGKQDTENQIRLKLLAVCAVADPRLDVILEVLLHELAAEKSDRYSLITKCNLNNFFWQQMKRMFKYETEAPTLSDFIIELFKSCYAMGTYGSVRLSDDALVFLKRWKDSRQYSECFEKFSDKCADILNIEQDLMKRDFRKLIELDYFFLIDKKIISDLIREVVARTISYADVVSIVRQRRQSHWYDRYRHTYEAIDAGASFMHLLGEVTLALQNMDDAIERYRKTWFKLDQVYRKFVHNVRKSGQASLTSSLLEQIESLYINNFLLKVNDLWQGVLDKSDRWNTSSFPLQREFFKRWVEPFLKRENKACIIISDALRYEIGEELAVRVRQEDRYGVELEVAVAMLPSYTQLGMAALLPHKSLAFAEGDASVVLVDGQSSLGTPNRQKILAASVNSRAIALDDEKFMQLKGDECRVLLKDNDLIYVYHNRIDITGKRDSEERVFEAAEETIEDLIRIIKKFTNANASNILVTADHGFLYQNRELEESDFSSIEPLGEEVLIKDRRFIVGKKLKEQIGLKKFTSSAIGLDGDMDIQIPKSIQRLRIKGAGSRYVHGGASLQEIVLPVLKINKKRQSDVSAVEVDIIRGASTIITSGQLSVVFYQTQAATEKVQARTLRACIFTEQNEAISDSHEVQFDSPSENPREREFPLRFVLSRKADDVNGKEVILKLEERVDGTSHYKEYKTLRYTMRRSFTSDFDL